MQRAAPPRPRPLRDRCGNLWSGEHRRSSGQGGERWCRCSRVGGAWVPAGTQVGPEIAPCCWGWSLSVFRTAGTPSHPTGSSCGGWALGRCWSSWSGGSLARSPTETVKTPANNRNNRLDSRLIFQACIKISQIKCTLWSLRPVAPLLSSVLILFVSCAANNLRVMTNTRSRTIHQDMITILIH